MKKSSGFTLIEMIIVVGVIGILSTMVFVIIDNPSGRANAKKTQHDVSQVVRAVEQYRVSGYTTDGITDELTTGNTVSVPFGEKVAGIIPYLVDIRTKETSANDFCSNPNGIAYKLLKKLNGDSVTGLYSDHTNAHLRISSSNSDKRVLCNSDDNIGNHNFAIAVKIAEGIWACGGYSDNEFKTVKYFTVEDSGSLHISCSTAKSTFLSAESEEYNQQ